MPQVLVVRQLIKNFNGSQPIIFKAYMYYKNRCIYSYISHT